MVQDKRLKQETEKIENVLDKISSIEVHKFRYNTNKISDFTNHYGLDIEKLESIFPETVKNKFKIKNKTDNTLYKVAIYDELIPLLIEAIKELKFKIEKLEKEA